MKNTPNKWLNISLLCILFLTLICFSGTLYSFNQGKRYVLSYSQNQLKEINNQAIQLIQSSIQNQKDLMDQFDIPHLNSTEDLQIIQSKLDNLLVKKSSLFLKISLFSATGEEIISAEDSTLPFLISSDFIKKDTLFSKEISSNETSNGEVYFENKHAFLNIYRPIYTSKNDQPLYIVGAIKLDSLNSTLVNNKIHSKSDGYTIIKNRDMAVIMHPSENQIGRDSPIDRTDIYPNLDYVDLVNLEKEQSTHSSGTLKYHSYQWIDSTKKRAQKMAAYEWIFIGSQRWVVSSSADYDRHNKLHKQEVVLLSGLISLITLILLLLFLYIKNWLKATQIHQENQQLLAIQSSNKIQHELEKNLLQESKLEIVGLLTTSIVHDLNNFLTPLIGNLELLMDEYQSNSGLLEDLNEIYLAAQKGHDLSQQVLNFSKVANVHKETTSFVSIITDAIKTLQILIPKTVSIQQTFQNDAKVTIIPDQLQAIIYNLMINAIQSFHQKGQLFISTKFVENEDLLTFSNYSPQHMEKQHILLSIQDDGPGIPKEIQEKIFTPFFTTKSLEGGTGLGLFIVNSLIKKNDWLIKLQSNDFGTTFLIALPIE